MMESIKGKCWDGSAMGTGIERARSISFKGSFAAFFSIILNKKCLYFSPSPYCLHLKIFLKIAKYISLPPYRWTKWNGDWT